MNVRRTVVALAAVALLAACGDDDEDAPEVDLDDVQPTPEEPEEPEEPDEPDEPDEADEAEEAEEPEEEPTPEPTSHEVRSGETLSGIAAEYGVDLDELIEANDIDDPDHVEEGQELVIP